ncbi:FG-GAP repeat domain-containing protein [Polyangium jinanense]|uniref:VCBS repeat-containing protein n=1 Tax=Polyangium jinanense TaxID=2829994 RepID=A0A9X3XH47_9BACT|nr:VCBS repeat-containing protein [Polyangium jinanense]MDC3962257.1 VCBS repeat-containing protein [Polyangium jinanense]MDC3988948.1 VCBS repeat-containing protein [Polyangium jinanense]
MAKASITPLLLVLLSGGSLGCELIAKVDRSEIDIGAGGSGGAGGNGGAGGGECTPEDDENPCTEDVCEDGVPTHKPTAAGTALPDQVTGDCQEAVCDGNGVVIQQADDADLPDDMNECTSDVCTAGVPSNPPLSAGSACGAGLVCDGNGMCIGCNTPADCAGMDDECKARTCEAGVCGVSFTPANTPVAMQASGDCSAIVCDGSGDTTTIADDTDLPPDDADPCKVPSCSAGQPAVADAPDGTTCADGDACTQTDTCQAGMCQGADPLVCAVNETCTAGACVCPSGYSLVATTVAMASANGDVVAPDLDGDGKLDLVTVHRNSGQVSVRLGLGDGTFGPLVQYTVGGESAAVSAADLNGDGKTDIAFLGSSITGTLQVMLNQGDGTLAATVNYPTNGFPYGLAAADVDSDGDVDLAVAYLADNNVSVFLNQGDGTFAAKVDYPVTTSGIGSAVLKAGDLNKDGKPDLAFSRSGRVYVLLNQGDGTFGASTSYPVTGVQAFSIEIADLNGDGMLDLAAPYGNATFGVSVFLNQGDGSFAAAVGHAVPTLSSDVAAGDVDGDGDLDLALASSNGDAVHLFVNPGDASFGTPITYPLSNGVYRMTAADLNADGRADFVVGGEGPVNVFLSTCAP